MKRRLAGVLLLVAACAPSPAPREARSVGSASSGAAESDSARIARLEREARALAHTRGCTAPLCRAAPLGSRPCGGPRGYLPYCPLSTDSAALFAKLAELARAEQAYNSSQHLAGSCIFVPPPNLTLRAGRCVAAPSTTVGRLPGH